MGKNNFVPNWRFEGSAIQDAQNGFPINKNKEQKMAFHALLGLDPPVNHRKLQVLNHRLFCMRLASSEARKSHLVTTSILRAQEWAYIQHSRKIPRIIHLGFNSYFLSTYCC
jgi:hypothetical protein